jgi:tRNA(His) guanylyltransferase
MNNHNDTPSLTTRMKGYEDAFRYYFTKRTPLIVRLDGKSFSTWTKPLETFDMRMSNWMQEAVKYAMAEIQGCVFAFSVSDEISLFLRDWDKLTTCAWFDNNLQKIASVSASLVTAKFNETVKDSGYRLNNGKLATFDSRAFTLPKDEVVNYFIWRQHEGIRNSVQMLGQELFGHAAIKGMNNNEVKRKIEIEKPEQSWDKLDPIFRHGFAIRKDEDAITTSVPLFKEDRQYIEDLIYVKGE